MMMNNINNNITPSTMVNDGNKKYKSEKRIYREKDEFYYNLQNGQNDFGQNSGFNKGLGTSSSSDENYNGENEIKYENIDNMRNNYGLSNKNKKFQNYQMNEDINKNHYPKDNFVDNKNMLMNNKRGYNDNRLKAKNYNNNFNESNNMLNNYYK